MIVSNSCKYLFEGLKVLGTPNGPPLWTFSLLLCLEGIKGASSTLRLCPLCLNKVMF